LFVFKIPASGTDFRNTGLLPASANLAVKYRPGRWNTGHLATRKTHRFHRANWFVSNGKK